MRTLIDVLAANPLLLLFAVVALGYPLGRLSVRGVSLGVAAILFSGLLVGSLDERLRLPEVISLLGLVIFVYSVGLSSGPGFFASLRRHGARNAALAVAALGAAVGTTLLVGRALSLDAGTAAGLFAGALTNTPSLAAVLDALRNGGGAGAEARIAAPVVAYSVAYPLGVLVPIICMSVAYRRWRESGRVRETQEFPVPAPASGDAPDGLLSATVRVTRPDAEGPTIRDLRRDAGANVVPGRVRRADRTVELASDDTTVAVGELVTLVGARADVMRMTERLGEASDEQIHLDRSELDVRRMFVSNRAVAGHSLRALDLPQQFGALVTAIRRGDADWVPNGDTVLQLGDRVRVLARRESMGAVARLIGDSYRQVSEFDVLTFGFGIVLGIAVGLLPIPLAGGLTVSLGLAGGPLIVGMLLGARGRTGPLVWGIPYGASQTLRQLGLILFFAGVGTRSGYAFASALRDPATAAMFGGGALVTLSATAAVLLLGHFAFRVPARALLGMVAGVHTQPAALSFAIEHTGDETPNLGYAAVYPFATVLKILLAQLLVASAW